MNELLNSLAGDPGRDTPAIPLRIVDQAGFDRWLADAGEIGRNYAAATGFEPGQDRVLLVPGPDGRLAEVLVGRSDDGATWTLASLPKQLPEGDFELRDAAALPVESLALGWALGSYRFDRYKSMASSAARLRVDAAMRDRLAPLIEAWAWVRDLVNTPASDLGPAELADEAAALAKRHGARIEVIDGERLAREFPAIEAVGRASTRAPRLICMRWGEPGDPPLALVGKGVVFDSGGLNLKSAAGMVLMKKDMGGAAHALALAGLVMQQGWPVDLRVYVPAVENAVSGNAYRPSDIVRTRSGTTVEIGNTDAEGRVVLADALTLAGEQGAERIIDFATLTGAARIALGEDVMPLYARDAAQARALQDLSFELDDPLWHMPLYYPYKQLIQPRLAELTNSGGTSHGGSLTAALFLEHFVPQGVDWMHLDIYAWNTADRPGRPAGGEAQSLRTLSSWLEQRYRR
ncbi:MAG: leucyl aminopeptidase family protein [Wenzhouxiangellaceae bacterium]